MYGDQPSVYELIRDDDQIALAADIAAVLLRGHDLWRRDELAVLDELVGMISARITGEVPVHTDLLALHGAIVSSRDYREGANGSVDAFLSAVERARPALKAVS